MPVTESALRLRAPDPTRLLPTLAEARRIQDDWHLRDFPHLPSSASDRFALWFGRVDDPSQLLARAKRESAAAHWDWYGLDEHQVVFVTRLRLSVMSDVVRVSYSHKALSSGTETNTSTERNYRDTQCNPLGPW